MNNKIASYWNLAKTVKVDVYQPKKAYEILMYADLGNGLEFMERFTERSQKAMQEQVEQALNFMGGNEKC